MKTYRYLFGPVPSRRFGRSLGIDLIPRKTCSLDCVFCQLGRTTRKTLTREEHVPVKEVLDEIDDWLKAGGKADFLTLSGSGEPTLHSRFGEVLEFVRGRANIPAALLTNGTTLHIPGVRTAACRANVVKVSLSAWDQDSFEQVNRPCAGLRFDELIEGEKAFRAEFKGELWMEVFIVDGINSLAEHVSKIAALAGKIGPDRVQLNTAVRPPAEGSVAPVPRERLEELAGLFSPRAEVIAEFSAAGAVDIQVNEDMILRMLRRRPCTAEQISDAFSMQVNEVTKHLEQLERTGYIRAEQKDRSVYYLGN